MKLDIYEDKGIGWVLNVGDSYQVVMTYEEIEKRLRGERSPVQRMTTFA